jgi:hypothetical protein
MLHFWTREQCEQFHIMHFSISCATCERSDQECPWHRRDDPGEDSPESVTALAV